MNLAQQLYQATENVTKMINHRFASINRKVNHLDFKEQAQMQVKVLIQDQTRQQSSSEL